MQPDSVVQFSLLLSYKKDGYAAAIRFYNYDLNPATGTDVGEDRRIIGARSVEDDFPTNLVGFHFLYPGTWAAHTC